MMTQTNYILGLLPTKGANSQATIDQIETTVKGIISRFERFAPFYTDHGPRHSRRIIEILDDMLRPVKKQVQLNSIEAFALAAAAWLHDIGYVISESAAPDQEDNHHELSAQFVTNSHQALGIRSSHLARVISALCKAHRRRVDIPSEMRTSTRRILNKVVRVRFLCGLISLADALDCAHDRAPEFDSEYVSTLRESDAWHWKVCQMISGVGFDFSNIAVCLDAEVTDEKELDMLIEKVGHLQEELDRVVPELIPNGVQLLRVLATYNGSHVDGRTLSPFRDSQEKLAVFHDLRTVYHVAVIGHSGCRVRRDIEFVNAGSQAVTSRQHHFFSDASFYELDPDAPVKAWAKLDELLSRVVANHGGHRARCEFEVLFGEAVAPGETYGYSYELFWPDVFPDTEESFTGTDFGFDVSFVLEVDRDVEVHLLRCYEDLADGQRVKLAEDNAPEALETSGKTKIYTVSVRKRSRSSNATLSWKWTRPDITR